MKSVVVVTVESFNGSYQESGQADYTRGIFGVYANQNLAQAAIELALKTHKHFKSYDFEYETYTVIDS